MEKPRGKLNRVKHVKVIGKSGKFEKNPIELENLGKTEGKPQKSLETGGEPGKLMALRAGKELIETRINYGTNDLGTNLE